MEFKEIKNLYLTTFGVLPEKVEKLPGAGSTRRYYKVEAPKDAPAGVPQVLVATVGSNPSENRLFINLAAEFGRSDAYKVPRVYGYAEEDGCYIQSWHGEESLFDRLRADGPEACESLCGDVLRSLVAMQTDDKVDLIGAGVGNRFDARQIHWDLNYFKYEFLKPAGIEPDESALEDDFDRLADVALSYSDQLSGFMYRDFQSRNIMLDTHGPVFIDFQGGGGGPLLYDVVSFLWQAKAGFSAGMRRRLLDVYVKALSERRRVDMSGEIERLLPVYRLLRTLQVLGAYGFRGLVEHKAHFIESIPGALKNLAELIEEGAVDDYPELLRVSRILVGMAERYTPRPSGAGLRVEVFSFSYKRGYPEDFSGNGGGFMFDCRGMHNPGRYDEYKQLTGLDRPVIDFLEERGEAARFIESAVAMVEPSVDSYLRRGFNNLQVAFGCTGGRHRSVYCAQHMAERLAARYPEAEIVLHHRERGIHQTFKSNK
ncbi:MAG: phosphotransferase [Muribaculaceae bacterium]|nr:phosphotransferase [Muribaculaceae bacterium]